MKKILIVAYKIEKGKGSEDGAGYNYVVGLLKHNVKITLVSRINNIDLLKKDKSFKDVELIGVDVPQALSFYKKGARGIALYYYLWQIFVGKKINKLRETRAFDVVHNLNFHTDWAPHFIKRKKGEVIVWGPIYHGESVPLKFVLHNKFKTYLKLFIRYIAQQYFWRLDPFLQKAIKNTDVIIYGNKNISSAFITSRHKIKYIPVCGTDDNFKQHKRRTGKFVVLSVGRFDAIKCFPLVVDSFERFTKKVGSVVDVKLVMIGDGEQKQFLRKRVKDKGIQNSVDFVPWISREDLKEYYNKASVFVFPSFEPQGLVVFEAMAAGTPVICIDGTGPHFLIGDTGESICRGNYNSMVEEIADKLEKIYIEYSGDETKYFSRVDAVYQRYDAFLSEKSIISKMYGIYE